MKIKKKNRKKDRDTFKKVQFISIQPVILHPEFNMIERPKSSFSSVFLALLHLSVYTDCVSYTNNSQVNLFFGVRVIGLGLTVHLWLHCIIFFNLISTPNLWGVSLFFTIKLIFPPAAENASSQLNQTAVYSQSRWVVQAALAAAGRLHSPHTV